jgi:hypothetical protein
MEITSCFETKVTLTPKDLGREIQDIDKILEQKIRDQFEGKCSRHGYVLPNSVRLLSRSIGMLEKGRFTGDILFYAEAESKVLQPPDGVSLIGRVERKNKMGMYVTYKVKQTAFEKSFNGRLQAVEKEREAIRVMVPRDLHIGNLEFDGVKAGDYVEVEIKKSRYQVNDSSILSVGVFLRKVNAPGEATELPPTEVPQGVPVVDEGQQAGEGTQAELNDQIQKEQNAIAKAVAELEGKAKASVQ